MIAPNIKRATIYLNLELHRALKIKAARCGLSISDLVQEAVRLVLMKGAIDLETIKERKKEPEKDFSRFVKELEKDGLL